MTFAELIEEARDRGYNAVIHGDDTISLDEFESNPLPEHDYLLSNQGDITYWEHGFEWFSKLQFVRLLVTREGG